LFAAATPLATPPPALAPLPASLEPARDELRLRIAAIEPDELTPRRALELLYELRQLARSLTSGAAEPF